MGIVKKKQKKMEIEKRRQRQKVIGMPKEIGMD